MSRARTTRREAMASTAGLGAALLATRSGLLRADDAYAQGSGDTAILGGLLALEQASAVAYGEILRQRNLERADAEAVESVIAQEAEHAKALSRALEERGGAVPEPPAPGAVPGLLALRDRTGSLRFALALETTAVNAYYLAIQRADDPKLLATFAGVMANEGQHLVVIRELAGRNPLPHSFETGEPETTPLP